MNKQYKTAIITGASSGIGAAIAKKLCNHGITVYALARNQTLLDEVKASLPVTSRRYFIAQKCDITDKHEVEQVFTKVFIKNPVDLIVSNAGIGFSKKFNSYNDKEICDVINTNLLGNINVIRATLANKGEYFTQVVCTSSLAGKMGFSNLSVYSATKFAIEGLVEALRGEYKDNEVAFTIFRPGITATKFFDKAGMQAFEEGVRNKKNYFTPEKVADIFINNLSPQSRTITVGNDKYFLLILPFIPFRYRFKILDIINKI